MVNGTELKLIYIKKVGYNTKGNGLFEFIFSKDPTNIDVERWNWDISPACDNALPPEEAYIDAIYNLNTKIIDLFCLHEAVDREYMHGYHTIHALAYEIDVNLNDDGFVSYDNIFSEDNDDVPLLVFHYGMSFDQIKDMLDQRKIILKGENFIDVSSVKL